jgi:hypothetical protein
MYLRNGEAKGVNGLQTAVIQGCLRVVVGVLVELRYYEVAVVTLDDGRWCERRAVIVVVSVHDGARRVVLGGGVWCCNVHGVFVTMRSSWQS